ncbi:phosphonate C-P lyase system protein PhnG [Hoeflea sp. EC-HK425]|uniref:phosphonate C-P lyase system protein PhnG n=1 Tax=Hoeflea sp. EC-HK425 TaxID=2038388 RepID=UPI0012580194|nr:phosphonate C-P lyase system protein PhnG [Hoeflea sp. EC-HK425]VVT09851.1 Alpha-D-ribose 1-methylphosphonate 5-triphosphate synthase subunit PhnG [Hoeflea sp. EC-HK425]
MALSGNGLDQTPDGNVATDIARRQRLLSVLARAPSKDLVSRWKQTGLDPSVELLRGPESGLVALQGRAGGTGQPFHVGEVSATRVTVRIGSGQVGHAMISGRDARKAQLVAVIDALAQDPGHAELVEREIVAPLEQLERAADARIRQETAATRVNFFTMVRGED